jgi:hypothetical protein
MVKHNYTLSNLSKEDLEKFKSLFNYDEVRSSMSPSIDRHYIRVYGFRYWDQDSISEYESKVQKLNSELENHYMKINEYDDYEVEYDGDRSYPASFSFSIISK